MKIGILGAGNFGGTMGKVWAEHGHEIFFGVRDPQSEKIQTLLHSIQGNVRAVSIPEAAQFADIVMIAVHLRDVPQVLAQIKPFISGKILIDSTNRFQAPPPDSATSSAEEIARTLPEAIIIKAFNTLGANNLTNLKFGTENASTFICGNDENAKKMVAQLGEEIGFDVVDAGPLEAAVMLESLTKFWAHLSRMMGREIAFKLLRRS